MNWKKTGDKGKRFEILIYLVDIESRVGLTSDGHFPSWNWFTCHCESGTLLPEHLLSSPPPRPSGILGPLWESTCCYHFASRLGPPTIETYSLSNNNRRFRYASSFFRFIPSHVCLFVSIRRGLLSSIFILVDGQQWTMFSLPLNNARELCLVRPCCRI